MNLLAPVKNLMTKDLITVSPNDNLLSVKEIFEQHSIHHLPVVETGKLVGIVSKSDFLLFSSPKTMDMYEKILQDVRGKSFKVKDIMTTGLAKLDPDDKLNVALEVFRVNKFHALPVVEEDQIVGILTTFDIINYLATDQGAEMKYV